MMASIWLACCARDDYPQVLAEVRTRDERAQVLRFGSVADLPQLIERFPDEAAGVAVLVREMGGADLEHAVGDLSRSGRVRQCLVFVGELDAGAAARLFHAGATEVIAVEGAVAPPPRPGTDACTEGSLLASADGAAEAQADALEVPIELEECYAAQMKLEERAHAVPSLEKAAELSAARRGAADSSVRRAPVIAAISGRGGVGKTTLLAAMACCAARMGLRAAVLDLDLMFGNLYDVLGIDEPHDLGLIARRGGEGPSDEDIEASAMRVGPGLTLWGPALEPEQAECLGVPCERLIEVLRGLADVIFVDTSVFWGDAVAAAVAVCDRCLVVGGAGTSSCASAARAASLAARLGVPRTRMTSVVNCYGAEGCGEEFALRFEMAVSLRSKARIADGGSEVSGMLSFGYAGELAAGKGAFARSIREFTGEMLRELGCPVLPLHEEERRNEERPRLRLPWKQRAGERP